MKKYKLKEEAKNYLTLNRLSDFKGLSQTELQWSDCGFSQEALEEVPQRVELEWYNDGVTQRTDGICKVNQDGFNSQEKDLCEQALNGELLTPEDVLSFHENYEHLTDMRYCFNETFKQFLKERK